MGDLQAVEPLLANPGIEPLIPGGSTMPVRGAQALFQRRYAAAIEIFSNAVAAAKPENPNIDAKLFLGLSQQRAGDVAAARAAYQSAVQDIQRELEKVAPDSYQAAETHAGLGLAYAGLGEAASAIAEGQKAMAIHPASKDPFEGPEEEDRYGAHLRSTAAMPITRFPFSSGCCRYRMAVRLLRRCSGSIRCSIRFGTIRASRNSSPRPRLSNIWGAVGAARSTSLRARLYALRSVKSAQSAACHAVASAETGFQKIHNFSA